MVAGVARIAAGRFRAVWLAALGLLPAQMASVTFVASSRPAQADLADASNALHEIDIFVAPRGSDDVGDGSPYAPYRTILVASRHARPGAIVHVYPGEYDGGFVTTASGAVGKPIRYVSEMKSAARIVPPVTSSYDMAWDNRGDHVVVDGFTVDGSKVGNGIEWRLGIYTTGSNSVVQHSYVHHIATHSACGSKGAAGIEGDSYYGGAEIEILANVVHDIGSRSCSYAQGVYHTSSGLVANNVVYRVSGWGIHLWHDIHDVLVANNTVFANETGGILIGGGDYVWTKGPADRVTVANNIVVDNRGEGIAERGQTGSHNLFTHNLVYGNGANWSLLTSAPDAAAISADPRFVGYRPDSVGDYRLAAGSPAVGACDRSYAPEADIGDAPRQGGAECDLGAYQSPAPR
jgi:hypothetical protein